MSSSLFLGLFVELVLRLHPQIPPFECDSIYTSQKSRFLDDIFSQRVCVRWNERLFCYGVGEESRRYLLIMKLSN